MRAPRAEGVTVVTDPYERRLALMLLLGAAAGETQVWLTPEEIDQLAEAMDGLCALWQCEVILPGERQLPPASREW